MPHSRQGRLLSFLLFIGILIQSSPFAFAAAGSGQSAKSATIPDDIRAILEKHVAALGGREKIDAVLTVEQTSETEIFGSKQKNYRFEDRKTGRFYARNETPTGVIESGFDGKRVWRNAPFFRGYLEDSDPQAKSLSSPPDRLHEYREKGWSFTRQPDETVEGTPCVALSTRHKNPQGEDVLTVYFLDAKTFLLRRVVEGEQVKVTTTFDDYRDIGGQIVAFRQALVTPQVSLKTSVVEVKFNLPIPPNRFDFPNAAGAADAAPKKTAPEAGNGASGGKGFTEATRDQTFEQIWKTINDSHWDATFGGVNWKDVHDRYLPLVRESKTSADFHKLMNRMVGELNHSHVRVIPPDQVRGVSSRDALPKEGSPDLAVRWLDGKLVVTEVGPELEKEGLRPGFVIAAIDGKTPDDMLKTYRAAHPEFRLSEGFERVRAGREALRGKLDQKVKLDVLDGADQPRTILAGRREAPAGLALSFESRRLTPEIGYIKFDVFFGDVFDKFKAALDEFRDTKGLIIDLRGNPGGVGQLASSIAGLLSDANGSLGLFQYRFQKQDLGFTGSGDKAYRGKVVVLVDELSASTSEVFSGGLQETKRVTVIGTGTAGAVLPSLQSLLPTGGALQYVVANFATPRGVVLEGRGVSPDVAVTLTRKTLLAGGDDVLARARTMLEH